MEKTIIENEKKSTLTIDNSQYKIKTGQRIKEVYKTLNVAKFRCLQGKCGRCLVQLLEGNLGEKTQLEKNFLLLMDLENKPFRLLCQGTLEENSIVSTEH